jgi:hypothetical protein
MASSLPFPPAGPLGEQVLRIGPGVAKVKMVAKSTLSNDSNGVNDTHHPCAEPVWRLPVYGARCRTLSLRPSRPLRALGGAFLTCTTAGSCTP